MSYKNNQKVYKLESLIYLYGFNYELQQKKSSNHYENII